MDEGEGEARFLVGDRVRVRGVVLLAGGENAPVDGTVAEVQDLIALRPMSLNGRWLYRVVFEGDRPRDIFGDEVTDDEGEYFGDFLTPRLTP